jgi:maltooligosyltrehalose trehalohydrolase
MFLQNHDQVGNRAMGERLRSLCDEAALYAATGLVLLSPQIPMLFMEEQYGSKQPFLFFTDYHDSLADAVREGRRKEFAKFSAFTDAKRRAQIPDPNDAGTLRMSSPDTSAEEADRDDWLHFYRSALAVRAKLIMPRLRHSKAIGATVLGDKAVQASWKLGDGNTLAIALNLGNTPVALPDIPAGRVIFETPARARDAAQQNQLGAQTFIAWLTGDWSQIAFSHDARSTEASGNAP